VDNYPVLVKFLEKLTRKSSKLFWEPAVPVLQMLKTPDIVVFLHAMADILEPSEKCRKLFETSGFKLSEYTAVLRKHDEKLALLEDQAACLTTVEGKQMYGLMQCSNLFEAVDGYIVLNWPNHEWSTSQPQNATLSLSSLFCCFVSWSCRSAEEHFGSLFARRWMIVFPHLRVA
jgi:hypothetical protein